LLAEDRTQTFREQPRDHIGGAARREWNNDAHRPIWPLGSGRCREGNNAGQDRDRAKTPPPASDAAA
jgi:hypothetical protein